MKYIDLIKNFGGDKKDLFKALSPEAKLELIFEMLELLKNSSNDFRKCEKIYTRIAYYTNDELATSIKNTFEQIQNEILN